MSSTLYVFAPIPRPALWVFSSNPQPPPGHIALVSAGLRRGRQHPPRTELALVGTDDGAAARGDLERLIAIFARLEPEQRSHLVELARQLIESEEAGP